MVRCLQSSFKLRTNKFKVIFVKFQLLCTLDIVYARLLLQLHSFVGEIYIFGQYIFW